MRHAKKLRHEPLSPLKFNLGKYGLFINAVAIAFLMFCWVFAFFPTGPKPAVQDMNWSVLGYGVVLISAVVYYIFRERHVYVDPVEYVRKGDV